MASGGSTSTLVRLADEATSIQKTIARWFSPAAASATAKALKNGAAAIERPTFLGSAGGRGPHALSATHDPGPADGARRPRDAWSSITVTGDEDGASISTRLDTADPSHPGGPDAYVAHQVRLDRGMGSRAVTTSSTVRVRNERGFLDRRAWRSERRLLPGVTLEEETREEYRFRDGERVRTSRQSVRTLQIGRLRIPLGRTK